MGADVTMASCCFYLSRTTSLRELLFSNFKMPRMANSLKYSFGLSKTLKPSLKLFFLTFRKIFH